MHSTSIHRKVLGGQIGCPRPLSTRPVTRSLTPSNSAVPSVNTEKPRAVDPSKYADTGSKLSNWLKENGAPEQGLEIQSRLPQGAVNPVDYVVASRELKAGEVVLDVPEDLCLTLDRIFESEFVAEVLTTDKLSEISVIVLYLMYEKKVGPESYWAPLIAELDKQRGRSNTAVTSPLMWDEAELEDLLQGSPVVKAVKERLAGIKKEYDALDTVWFMAGSLFNKYPVDMPTEAFSFKIFREAFAAVQASIVHLQGVPLAKRFALVPMGPPLLTYSSTSKGMLRYNQESKSVQLTTERELSKGDIITAWCGPQPNSRLLVNYGIVDESNPYDKLQLQVTLPNADPLFQVKRSVLNTVGFSTQMSFDLSRQCPLPPHLIPFMQVAIATSEEKIRAVKLVPAGGLASSTRGANTVQYSGAPSSVLSPQAPGESSSSEDTCVDAQVLALLVGYFNNRLAGYKHPLWKDMEIIEDPAAKPRQKVAARLVKIEKCILKACLDALKVIGGDLPSEEKAAAALKGTTLKMN